MSRCLLMVALRSCGHATLPVAYRSTTVMLCAIVMPLCQKGCILVSCDLATLSVTLLHTVWVLGHLQNRLCLYIVTSSGQIQAFGQHRDMQVYSSLSKSIHATLIVSHCFVGVMLPYHCSRSLPVMRLATVVVLSQSLCFACL